MASRITSKASSFDGAGYSDLPDSGQTGTSVFLKPCYQAFNNCMGFQLIPARNDPD